LEELEKKYLGTHTLSALRTKPKSIDPEAGKIANQLMDAIDQYNKTSTMGELMDYFSRIMNDKLNEKDQVIMAQHLIQKQKEIAHLEEMNKIKDQAL
jgi:hypothetical protein